jgi:hypothetical protein
VSALDRLRELASGLGPDEQAVLLLVAERLTVGRERYGELQIECDRRDFRTEALEEAADRLVYAACALVQGMRRA